MLTRMSTPIALASVVALVMSSTHLAAQPSRTLVAVLAHADDEAPIAPLLARYSREGVRTFMIVVTNGNAGAGQEGHIPRPDIELSSDELASTRAGEAQCSAKALGMAPPILLDFPDGKLGDYVGDRALIYRVTDRIAQELQRLNPDVVITWGPDGGTGHPDHRIVSGIVTELQRTGAAGVPERLFYMNLPVESMRAMNPQRGVPPLVVPQDRYFTTRVSFAPEDFTATKRSMACHATQLTPEVNERVSSAALAAWKDGIPLIPAFAVAPGIDVFR